MSAGVPGALLQNCPPQWKSVCWDAVRQPKSSTVQQSPHLQNTENTQDWLSHQLRQGVDGRIDGI